MGEMQTANGVVESKYEVDVYSHDLKQKFTALLLPDVCPVVSLGKLTKEGQWLYHWRPDQPPYLKSLEDGRVVSCTIEHDTPLILPSMEVDNLEVSQEEL